MPGGAGEGTVPAPSGARCRLAPLLALACISLTGCSESATPLVQRLAAAPVPEGAVLQAAEQSDGGFELGPEASLEYVLTAPLAEACPQTLRLYADAGYALTDYVDNPDAIADPDNWCARELQPADGTPVLNVIAIAYPPDEDSRYSVDGVVIVLVDGDDGTVLRMSAG